MVDRFVAIPGDCDTVWSGGKQDTVIGAFKNRALGKGFVFGVALVDAPHFF